MKQQAVAAETDRRWHRRMPAGFGARVLLDDHSPALECTVRNLSPRGARLAFASACELPNEFALEIPNFNLQVKACLVWSRDEDHGVMFVWPQLTPWT